MKIVYLHQYFNTPDMSGSTRSYEMARRLVAKGHEVHMITSWGEPKENQGWFETNEAGINVHWLPVRYSNHMPYLQRIKAFFKFALASAKKAVEIKCDIIFATSTPLTIALPAVYAKKKQKVPMVFEVRDLWPLLPIAMGALKHPFFCYLAYKLEKFAYKNSDSIVALSPGMRDGIIQVGYPENKVTIIPNSSDIDLFLIDGKKGVEFRLKRPLIKNKPLLIYTGTFGLINGIDYMVDLAQSLIKIGSDVQILLIGDGREFNKVKAQAKKEGVLNDNLFIESQLPKKEIPAAISAATIVCSLFIDIPEMRSNSANKFFDALAAGKPVLINYGGWQKDLLDESGAGFVAWRKPITEVAESVHKLAHDDVWLLKASESSKKLALDYFDRDMLATQLEEVLCNCKTSHI